MAAIGGDECHYCPAGFLPDASGTSCVQCGPDENAPVAGIRCTKCNWMKDAMDDSLVGCSGRGAVGGVRRFWFVFSGWFGLGKGAAVTAEVWT